MDTYSVPFIYRFDYIPKEMSLIEEKKTKKKPW